MNWGVSDDTICAPATSPGTSAIGVVRVSGPDTLPAISKITATPASTWRPRQARLVRVRSSAQTEIDDALITYFCAPNSYTGEDVAEISCHGSPLIINEVISALIDGGLRLAQPGEFTFRAFQNGKLDLLEAEAVNELIHAKSLTSAGYAVRKLHGGLSKDVENLVDKITEVMAHLEADLDFVEDELDTMPRGKLLEITNAARSGLEQALENHVALSSSIDGKKLVIAGPANAGKSALLNALTGYPRAIVSARAGTTRDYLAEPIYFHGQQHSIIDTAGLRVSDDETEREGIARSQQLIDEADLVLWVEDLSTHRIEELLANPDVVKRVDCGGKRPKQAWKVWNKIDLADPGIRDSLNSVGVPEVFWTSAVNGVGVDELKQALSRFASDSSGLGGDACLLSQRQYESLKNVHTQLVQAEKDMLSDQPTELILIGLNQALRELMRLRGVEFDDQVMDRVFSEFCLGK